MHLFARKVSIALTAILLPACGVPSEETQESKRTETVPVEASWSPEEIRSALELAKKSKQDNTMVVVGGGRAENKNIRFVCDKEQTCEIPKKLFDNDVEGTPEQDWDFAAWLVTDLLGKPLQDVPNLKKFKLVSRKDKIIVIVKFTKKKAPVEVLVENPEGGSIRLDGVWPCGTQATCQSFQVPFDDFMDLSAVAADGWEVETWTIADAINAARTVPDLKKIVVKQTKNGLKIRIKFRKKRAVVTTAAEVPRCAAVVASPLGLAAPTPVCTAADLAKIAENPSGDYRLVCDVNMLGVAWKPIPQFSGRLDGSGRKIIGLKSTETVAESTLTTVVLNVSQFTEFSRLGGLFGSVSGTVANLQFVDADVNWNDSDYSGVLAGRLLPHARISNIVINGRVESTNRGYHGGLAGEMADDVVVEKICVDAEVVFGGLHTRPLSSAGGILGRAEMTRDEGSRLEQVTFYGSVTVIPQPQTAVWLQTFGHGGGIIGTSSFNAVLVRGARFEGRVAAIGAGGILGFGSIHLEKSTSSGQILCFGGGWHCSVGGLAGHVQSRDDVVSNGAYIKQSSSDATIGGVMRTGGGLRIASVWAGGLIGTLINHRNPGRLIDSYFTGLIAFDAADVNTPNPIYIDVLAGGLVGRVDHGDDSAPAVQNSYSAGTISIRPASGGVVVVGGVIGQVSVNTYIDPDSSVLNSYWNTKTTGDTKAVPASSTGVGVRTNDLLTPATFVGWNFQDVWMFPPGGGYPLLR